MLLLSPNVDTAHKYLLSAQTSFRKKMFIALFLSPAKMCGPKADEFFHDV